MKTYSLFETNQILKDPLRINAEKETIQTKLIIDGINIYFPYKPYQSQINYMNAVIKLFNAKLIDYSINGIGALESPTGTGKTLSLLCATLAWVNEMRKRKKFFGQIFFITRTHSQITQLIKELKKSCYEPEISILSSRDFSCINNHVKNGRNGEALNIFCKVCKNYCSYYYLNKKEKPNLYSHQTPIMDIEDLCKYDKKEKICPFYHQIEKAKNFSDIVFMPYNFLFVDGVKKSKKIELNNGIIIIDEAHNIRKICEDSKSVEIKSEDFVEIFKDMEKVKKIIIDKEKKIENKYDKNTYSLIIKAISKITESELISEISAIKNFEKNFSNVKIGLINRVEEQSKHKKNIGKVLSYNELNNLFIRIDNNNIDKNNIILFNNQEYENPDVFINKRNISQHLNRLFIIKDIYELTNVKMSAVNIIINLLKILSNFNENNDQIDSYKFFICDQILQIDNSSSKKTRFLKIMCFNPALALNDIINENPYSIIFTSGTLKPFEILETEFNVKFDIKIENIHNINASQCHFSIIKSIDYNGKIINFNFTLNNRENQEMLLALGEIIYNLCKTNDRGTVIFFPCYSLLNECYKLWDDNHTIEKIDKIKKVIKDSRENKFFIKSLKSSVDKNYIFFSVCRGSSSEGIDFKDDDARMIICVGIPYSNLSDDKIRLKKLYLNNKSTFSSFSKKIGDFWYEVDAIINVNQALGRAIRHSRDYGAMICIDCRYETILKSNLFSGWMVRNRKIMSLKENDFYFNELKRFFEDCRNKYPVLLENNLESNDNYSDNYSINNDDELSDYNDLINDIQNEEIIDLDSFKYRNNNPNYCFINSDNYDKLSIFGISNMNNNNNYLNDINNKNQLPHLLNKKSNRSNEQLKIPLNYHRNRNNYLNSLINLYNRNNNFHGKKNENLRKNNSNFYDNLDTGYNSYRSSNINYDEDSYNSENSQDNKSISENPDELENIDSDLVKKLLEKDFDKERFGKLQDNLFKNCQKSIEKCPICFIHKSQSNFLEFSISLCNHIICNICWCKILKNKNICPLCRKEVDPNELRKIVLID